MVEHIDWDDERVEDETIVFEGKMTELVELLGPLLLSRRWKVNGRHEVKPFLRVLESAIQVRHGDGQQPLSWGTWMNVVQDYLDAHCDER